MTADTSPLNAEKGAWLDVVRSIWHFLGRNRPKYIFFNSVLFLVLFYELVPPFVVGKIVDFFSHYHAGDALAPFYFYAVFLGVSHIVISVIRLTSKINLTRIAIAAKALARTEGFERLMNFSLPWHAKENSGNKMQRIFTGSDTFTEWTALVQNSIFPAATNFIGVLGFFLFLSPIFTLFMLAYLAVFFTIERIFNRKLRALSNRLNQIREKSSGKYIEGTGNILAIKALGAEKDMNVRMTGSEEDFKNIQIATANTGTRKWYYFQTVNGISTCVFLLLVGHQFLIKQISVGDILVFFTYFRTLRESASNMTDISGKAIQLRSDLLRMMPIFHEKMSVATGTEKFPETWNDISIRDGHFKYPSGQAGMQGLNFMIRRGEKVGIVGPSGGGKSTLVKVLLGLYELEKGDFKIGDKDYYAISHEEVMKNISIVLQETELFNLSFAENITLGREVDPALLQTAIETARLQDVINRLPEGISTFVGERGYAISGGERQRIGIARAICKDAPVMLFDEATSALDSKTEKEIMDGLLEKSGKGKTFIFIAHRTSTLKDMDRVIMLEKGGVRKEGSYAQLFETSQAPQEQDINNVA